MMFATVLFKERGLVRQIFRGVGFEGNVLKVLDLVDGSMNVQQGYTGSLMVEHLDALLSMQPESKRQKWGVAGRNLGKLKRLGEVLCRDEQRGMFCLVFFVSCF